MDNFKIVTETMSDGSLAYNVIGRAADKTIMFACCSERDAHDLLMALEQVSYIEVD